jgi:glycosyltransferase involved in cell wall biosynthesis
MPSFFEGLSNTVCEAMACGRPILSSDVCDAGNLVQNGVNGFLFDPASPEDIAAAIMRFVRLSKDERATMGLRSRDRAAEIFDSRTVVDRYDQVLTAAATRKRLAIPHWVPEVPDAVYGFTGRESSP